MFGVLSQLVPKPVRSPPSFIVLGRLCNALFHRGDCRLKASGVSLRVQSSLVEKP